MKKILIIDDEFIFRQGLKYMINWESYGYTIIDEASNGKDGLQKCLLLHPDIILCDVVMPVLNGVEFVKKIRLHSSVPIIMLSNYDEFDKVRHAFQLGASDYLLKSRVTQETLLECLDRLTSVSQQIVIPAEKNFGLLVRQILDGYGESSDEPFLSYLSSQLPGPAYMLLVLSSPKPDFQTEQDLEETLHFLVPDLSLKSCFTTQNHALALLSLPAEAMTEWITTFLKKFSLKISHTSCVLSSPFLDIFKFREQVERLYDLTKYSILFESKLCFYEDELLPSTTPAPSFPLDSYTHFAAQGQWKYASDLLLEYIDKLKNSTQVNPVQFKKFVEHTFYSSLKNARNLADNPSDISRVELKLFKGLDQALTYPQVFNTVKNAYDELSSICAETSSDEKKIITVLEKYLEEHFAEQITLYDVAEHLHMNYSYLSFYISQNTGKHFSEHLNDARIRHAKLLLSNTEKSISYISENIGYSDQSYFGKIFKKQVGMTPLQYRNYKHGKEQL